MSAILSDADRDLAAAFAGPVLSISMEDATEEPAAQHIYADGVMLSLVPYESASGSSCVLVNARLYSDNEKSLAKVSAGFDLPPEKALELGQKLTALAEAMLAQEVLS